MATQSALLIDDEPLALERLGRLLAEHTDSITIVGEATNGFEGIRLIESLRPSVLFLDVQMPQLTGFEMLARLTQPPYVVFTTAYDQYALRAFEENSLDYLLKPVDAARLAKTIHKIQQIQAPVPFSLDTLRRLLSPASTPMRAITIKNGDSLELVMLDEIAFFQTAGKYVLLHTVDGKQHIVEYTLTELDERLPDQFVRISRASLVNRSLIRQLRKRLNGSYLLTLNDLKATQLETSTYSREILARLNIL